MNKPKRECGSCAYWIKWKYGQCGRGLCNLLDVAGKAEHGKKCPYWKGKKYQRNKDYEVDELSN